MRAGPVLALAPAALTLLCACGAALSLSCAHDAGSAEPAAGAIEAMIDAAARSTSELPVVGPHLNWSPFLCMMPPAARALLSSVDAEEGHGSKIYALRSNQGEAYMKLGTDEEVELPLFTVLVKEAFAPVLHPGEDAPSPHSTPGWELALSEGYVPFAERDGLTYTTGRPRGLFVMLRLPEGTPDTMDGWAYGTVDPAGRVTGSGAMESCIRCHRTADHGGVFGWPADD